MPHNTINVEDVRLFLREDFDALCEALADAENVTQFGSAEPSQKEKRRLGKALFDEAMKNIKPILCGKDGPIYRLAHAEETQIIASIGDIVIDKCGGTPVSLVTAMILKFGLEKLCNALG